ncbi:MAG: FliH/SctL family protein [Armatimonadota bacterium]
MNSLIKSNLLPSSDIGDEYLIEPGKELAGSLNSIKAKSPEAKAREMIAQAKDDARALVSEAQTEAESIRDSAYQEGYEAGMSRLNDEHEAMVEQIHQIEVAADDEVGRFWVKIEPELLRLSVEIASKIVRHNIEETDGFVLTTVKEGIRQLRDRQDLKVRVNPKDYTLMREEKDEVLSSCDGIRNLEIIDDRRVDEGGCIIESNNGDLDARIETQLSETERALLEASRYGRSEEPAES